MVKSIYDLPFFAFSRARSFYYDLQAYIVDPVSKRRSLIKNLTADEILQLNKALEDLLAEDCANIRKGLYPYQVLFPESPIAHVGRLPKLLKDGFLMVRRREKGNTQDFKEKSAEYLEELPKYYRRNFHFQTDGYLSVESAELYDHQVQILFSGTLDVMRRLIIPPLKKHFSKNPTGKGLTFLEIAGGSGGTTRFVRMAFPEAKIILTDLSYPYLKKAQERLKSFKKIDFVQAAGEELPFQDEKFDAVYSVYLFHELPLDARKNVIKDSLRVLKKGGFWGMVDALQKGDNPVADKPLSQFPKTFHEPFFRNYSANPMEQLLKEALPSSEPKIESGFFSKAVFAKK